MLKTLFFALLLIPSRGNAQATTFQMAVNFPSAVTEGDVIKSTLDGGYILAGTTNVDGSSETFLSKYNSAGSNEWSKIYYDQQSHISKVGIDDTEIYCNQYVRFLVATPNGYLFGGGIDSSVFITYSNGVTVGSDFTKMFAVLTDAEGNITWSKKFRASDNTFGEDAIETSDGNFLLAGSVNQPLLVLRDIILIKVDNPGNVIWSKSYGGGFDEGIAHLIETSPTHLMLCGTTESFSNNQDIYSLSLDSSGALLWSKNYGSSGFDYGKGVAAAADQGYYFFGNAGAGNPSYTALIKTDSAGIIQWANTYGNYLFDGPEDLFKVDDNNLIMLVNHYVSSYDGLACAVDADGNADVAMTYGKGGNNRNDFISSLIPAGNGFLLAGATNSFSGNQGPNQAYLIQTHDGLESDCFSNSISYTPTALTLNENTAATSVNSLDASGYSMFISVLDSSLQADTLCFSVATNAEGLTTQNTFSVFPNPANNELMIRSSAPMVRVTCFNQLGEIMFSKEARSATDLFMVTKDFPEGIYLLQTITAAGITCRQISIVH